MGRCHSRLPQVGKTLRPQQKDLLKSLRIIFVMGGPGCGKGTQCENMAAKYGFCHVGLGELLREEANQATVRGQQIRDIMLKGLLVPTGVILDMVSDNMLSRPESKGFLIDGFPRELNQAKEFERIAVKRKKSVCRRPQVGRSPNIVIVFDCSTETMIHRVLLRGQKGHREDDAEDVVRQRLETHYTLCEPILAFYQQKNLLRNILAEDAAENIFAKCCSVIDSLQ
ncbi:adenylate kinase isoenzyme 1 [Phascolarctos cinereus]|uniref:Adenylate kinase isoenzyme 1-like isoform X1 n=2 Tax=Phascolarctos cinereus TaxID=38626 RepID=A0A6P5IXS9_PHACI|nr:adenylate kinase isoenzyme 1-like isoform X1 [Phascolarctos cinereus]XP_020826908.1 adenylate kinase isoenzyme 1-like isoform X1 [Phascolarctos cinereus]XP_020826909.1 adenylate kinase isoenzyme 1-like isoform X1 [Phascolarctos cinereus]XP_020826910.1 adenylate kinase isoenzyme 1-like isoform X1 [Phascolarctos cinereus]